MVCGLTRRCWGSCAWSEGSLIDASPYSDDKSISLGSDLLGVHELIPRWIDALGIRLMHGDIVLLLLEARHWHQQTNIRWKGTFLKRSISSVRLGRTPRPHKPWLANTRLNKGTIHLSDK